MRLEIANARAIIRAGGDRQVFDTDDQLLHGAASGLPISGTIAIGAVSTDATVDTTTTYDLGAVTPGHTQIIGACKFDLNNDGAGLAFDRWHTVLGGSLLWVLDGEPGFSSSIGNNGQPRQVVTYWFEIVSGRAEMKRRVYMHLGPAGGPVYTVLSHNITYKLRSGNWT